MEDVLRQSAANQDAGMPKLAREQQRRGDDSGAAVR